MITKCLCISFVIGANLWLVAAHEIGHSLGLQHSFIQGSLMYPYHSGYQPDYQIHTDDIEGIEFMYGRYIEAQNHEN